MQAGIARKECSHAQTGLCWLAVCRDDVGQRRDFGSCRGVVLPRVWLCGARLWLWLFTLALPLILSTKIFLWCCLLSSARLGLARLGVARWWMGLGRAALGLGRAALGLGWEAMVGPGRDRPSLSRC
jgi:hypothetical protein